MTDTSKTAKVITFTITSPNCQCDVE